MPLGLGDVLPDARRSTLLRGTVNDLSPELSLLIQCVHARKHGWPRLEWIAAIAHTIARHPDLDWDSVVRAAEQHRATTSLGMGLVLARDLAGAPVPGELFEQRWMTRRTRAACRDVCGQLFVGDGRPLDASATVRLHFRNRSARDRISYVADLVHPSERDLAFVHLPPRLSFLYYGVRPVRLVVEHTALRRLRRQRR